MTSPAMFIGIDAGTSGVRAIAIDDGGIELGSAQAALPASLRDAGNRSIQQPEHWWCAAMKVLRALVAALPRRDARCIAVDGTSATVLLCAEDGQPLTPALMYDDASGREMLSLLRQHAPLESAVHSASSSLAKVLYLLRNSPRVPPAARVAHQADWITGRLLGRYGVSDENNSLKLGYDAARRCWPDWLGRLPVPSRWLPDVHPPGTLLGRIDPGVARDIGLGTDCLIASGTTDSTAAAIASGISRIGEAVTSLGSTLAIKVLSDSALADAAYGIYSHRVGTQWLVGGASNAGGAVLARYFTAERIAELSASPRFAPTRLTGLGYYPLLRPGERFPVNDPDLQPRLSPRPADDVLFLKGLLEGMAEIERRGYRLLQQRGAPYPTRVVSIGGGAVNSAWRELRETVLEVPVVTADHMQAAYGSAKLAATAYREGNPSREPAC